MSALAREGALSAPPAGPVILVTAVGSAGGAKAAAAALACTASEPDRAALLIDLSEGRPPRPTLIATAGARGLEEHLSAHMPDAAIASRGRLCQLTLPAACDGVERISGALPLARESAAIVHLPPRLLRPLLDETHIRPTGALLRADLSGDRALTALAARDLVSRGLRLSVLKRPPSWLSTRLALQGLQPQGSDLLLPPRQVDRLLGARAWPRARCRRP